METERSDQDQTSINAHKQLTAMVGDWEGISRVWFEGAEPVSESETRGTIRSVLGGRFIVHEYEGSFQDQPTQGIMLYGYNKGAGKFESSWVDTFHTDTAILFSEGSPEMEGIAVLCYYEGNGERWGWRTELALQDADHLTITAHNVFPNGGEAKAVETIYTRKS